MVDADQQTSAQAAVEYWHPEVVLLASDLPPTGGDAVCRMLRAKFPHLSILMLVENTPEAIEAAYMAGASDVLVSPILRMELLHRLRLLVDRAEMVSLRQREAWYRGLFEHAAEGIFRCTADGRLMMASPRLAHLLGFHKAEDVLRADLRLPLPTEQASQPYSLETAWKRADGLRVTLRLYARPVYDANQRLLYYEGVAIDITELRPPEAVASNPRIQSAPGLTAALADVVAVINSDLDLDHVLDHIMGSVGKLIPGDTGNIFLIDEHGIAVSVRTHGYSDPRLEQMIKTLRIAVSETANMQRMVETNQPVVITDSLTDPNWRPFTETAWIRSCINAPIAVDGRVIGFINLDSARPGAFDPVHAATLKLFADYAGIAIRNARLYGETRERAALLERQGQQYVIQLEQERERLRTLLDSIGDAVGGVVYDETGEVKERYSNPAFAELLGYEIGEVGLFGLKPADVTDDDWLRQVMQIVKWPEGVLDRHVEIRFQRRDGTALDADMHLRRMLDVRGQAIGDVAVIRDVTALNAVDAYRTRFISNAAHELRTPMSSFRTRLYLLERQPERLAEHLTVLNSVSDQLVNLVEFMLDLSRYENGIVTLELNRINLKPFIAGLTAIHKPNAEQKGVTFLTDLPGYPVYVTADSARLTQVVNNLLTNALNHTPVGGTVTLRAGAAGDQALIQVQDSGVGIAAEHLPHLFKPFYRAGSRSDSTGLGLAIVKEIVDLHHGRVTVESQVGKGSTFTVFLPLMAEAPSEAEAGAD